MRILVTGSRDWIDHLKIGAELCQVQFEAGLQGPQMTLVHGNCPTGADYWADNYALLWSWDIERHPADWKTFGKAAGPIRNQEMVDAGADICLAFIKDNSRGATHCANAAEKAGIPVRRYRA